MFTKLLTLSVLFISACCLSIGTVSEQNVTKREASASDLFPDWVPFKNKHGDELGEFVHVEKSKVKKRLALPMNFLLRAVAAPNEDYYDKGAGDSDNEDYYEKKDWSDLNRPAEEVDKKNVMLNHTDISDIDGVVDIITKSAPDHILKTINSVKKYKEVNTPEKIDLLRNPEQTEKIKREKGKIKDVTHSYNPTTPTTQESYEEKDKSKDLNNEEESEQSEEDTQETTENSKTSNSKEDKESEARKAKILSSVDDLKERHAEEQRELSDRIKGEDLYKDEFSKNINSEVFLDRFTEESSEVTQKPKGRKPSTKPDYDEYEDLHGRPEDKYKINVLNLKKTTPASTELPPKITTTAQNTNDVRIQTGKQSVFRNPKLYMMYDDSDESAALAKRGQQKFSSRYATITPLNSDDRISLVAVDSKEGEPTLFFPKIKKNKRKRIKSTTPAATDSIVAETVTDNYEQTTTTIFDVTAPEPLQDENSSTLSDVTAAGTTGTDYGSTGSDAVSTNSDAITDAVPASSHQTKKSGDYSNKKGGGREHHSEHSEEREEHGKKAYKGHHEDTESAKGHHDKENHLGKYDDHGGVNKHHSDESGHYGDHHHEEHGKKHAKYEESGKHSKGHSTKGSHDVHKKDEYEKKVEFFEEEGDSAEEEKHGGYNHEKEHSEGGRFKKGNLKAEHEHHSKGEAGHFDKGGHHEVHKGHKQSAGHDSHGKHGQKHFQEQGKQGGKKWIYHHGFPAKTANLVVIDRRQGQYYHGPHYYG